ncbi:MAG: DUF501 domain-containing protein [Bifidobacteriaceae bacterium]|jgi:hypothetical protein|nr:DUF501 domain-containing protein [Bifidobacteriaceae bacterium]
MHPKDYAIFLKSPTERCFSKEASEKDYITITEQLGRKPRGLLEISFRMHDETPAVIKTSPMIDAKIPFPTLYYLTHPSLVYACSKLEADGYMLYLNGLLTADSELREKYETAHKLYILSRDNVLKVPELANFSAGGMPNRVKCLHSLVAHSLAAGKGVQVIGDIVSEQIWCAFAF